MTNEETIAYFKKRNEVLISVAKDENVYDYEKQVIEADCMREQFEVNEKAIQALEQQPKTGQMTKEEIEIIKIIFQSYLNIVQLFKKPNYISAEVVTEVRDKLIKELEQWNSPYKKGECKDCYYNDGEVHAECVICDKAESEEGDEK